MLPLLFYNRLRLSCLAECFKRDKTITCLSPLTTLYISLYAYCFIISKTKAGHLNYSVILISLSTHLTRYTLHLTFVRLCCYCCCYCYCHPLMNDLISPTWGWNFSFKNNKSPHKYQKTRKKAKTKTNIIDIRRPSSQKLSPCRQIKPALLEGCLEKYRHKQACMRQVTNARPQLGTVFCAACSFLARYMRRWYTSHLLIFH